MKKILLLLAVVTIVGSTVTSCKVHGGTKCAAYGKAQPIKRVDKHS